MARREEGRTLYNRLSHVRISKGFTRAELADLVGFETLSGTDQQYLRYESAFETRLLSQGTGEDRPLDRTLDLAWDVLGELPRRELTMLPRELIAAHERTSAAQVQEQEQP